MLVGHRLIVVVYCVGYTYLRFRQLRQPVLLRTFDPKTILNVLFFDDSISCGFAFTFNMSDLF